MEVQDLITLKENGKLNGEFTNLPNEIYHDIKCPALSRSDLVIARRSLRHLQAKKNGEIEQKTSKNLEFGSLFHDFILEKDEFWNRYHQEYEVEPPKCQKRKKEDKETWARWEEGRNKFLELNKGKKEVSADDYQLIRKMEDSLDTVELVRNILNDDKTEFENSYFYDCPIFGQTMKFRPDIIMKEKNIMIDLKTTTDASPNAFRKSMANYFYDLQAAMYCYGAHQLFGGKWTFAFIVVEKTAPYGVALYTAGESEMEMGQSIYKDTAKIMKENVIKTAYPQQFSDIGLPAWGYDISYR